MAVATKSKAESMNGHDDPVSVAKEVVREDWSYEQLQGEADELRNKLNTFRTSLGRFLVEKQELIDLMVVAAVAQEPLLLVGPPGTAKSDLVLKFKDALGIRDEDYYEYMLTRFTEPSEIIGPIDISKLREGRYIRREQGKLPTCRLGFLDEIFKCLHGDSLVYFADGSRKKVGDIQDGDYLIPSMSITGEGEIPNNRLELVRSLSHVTRRPPEAMVKVSLTNGRSITCTLDHKLYARNPSRYINRKREDWSTPSWVESKDLKPGMMVACPTVLPVEGSERMDPDHLDLLALHLADGCTSGKHNLGYTKPTQPLMLKRWIEIATKSGDNLMGPYGTHGGSYAVSGQRTRKLINSYGLGGKDCYSKFVPEAVFRCPNDQVARFLALLWCGDGAALGQSIGYGSSSKQLLHDVADLWLRLGIHGTIKERMVKAPTTGTVRPFYSWISNQICNEKTIKIIREYGLGTKTEKMDKITPYQGTMRRSCVEGDILWVKIKSVEAAGTHPSYCLTVPKTENFVANGIVVHNSNSAILNILLTIVNEKKFYQDGVPQPVRLRVLFAATNEVPEQAELAALKDRFCLKAESRSVQEHKFVELVDAGIAGEVYKSLNQKPWVEGHCSLDDVLKANRYLTYTFAKKHRAGRGEEQNDRQVFFPSEVFDEFQRLVKVLVREHKIFISDRKLVKLYKLFRVRSWILTGGSVSRDDLRLLAYLGESHREIELLRDKVPQLLGLV